MTKKELQTLSDVVEKVKTSLEHHFETVQILCSWTQDGETYRVDGGFGNIYARTKHAELFAQAMHEAELESRLSDMVVDDEDDKEEWKDK